MTLQVDPADPAWDQAMASFDEASRVVASMPNRTEKLTPITNRVCARWFRGGPFEYGPESYDPNAAPVWTGCIHLPDGPSLSFGLGCLPGHLMCQDCWIAACGLGPERCDWCGVDQDPRVALLPMVHAIGPAVVMFLLCEAHCGEQEQASGVPAWLRRLRDTEATQQV